MKKPDKNSIREAGELIATLNLCRRANWHDDHYSHKGYKEKLEVSFEHLKEEHRLLLKILENKKLLIGNGN